MEECKGEGWKEKEEVEKAEKTMWQKRGGSIEAIIKQMEGDFPLILDCRK